MLPAWAQIILAIIGLFGVGDAIHLIFFRSTKKAEEAKADALVKENESKAVEAMEKTVGILKEELAMFAKMHDEDVAKIEKLSQEKNDLNSDLILCSNALCINALCPLRDPLRGLGDEYFCVHKDNLFNNKSFKKIAEERGFELKDCNGKPEVF